MKKIELSDLKEGAISIIDDGQEIIITKKYIVTEWFNKYTACYKE